MENDEALEGTGDGGPPEDENLSPLPRIPWYSQEELSAFSEFLTGDSERDQRNFRTLLATVTELLGEPDIELLLRKLLAHAIETTRSERGILLLLDSRGELEIRISQDFRGHDLGPHPPMSRTIPQSVIREGRPVLSRVSGDGDVLEMTQSVAAMRLRQVMCAPLRARGKTLGAIYVDSTLRGPPQSLADLMLFHAQAGLMGLALESHRLMRQQFEMQAIRQQLRLARKIQQKLLPESPSQFSGLRLAGISEASDQVGGDYFDYFSLDIERTGLSVGDVSGHGVASALIMANVRATLRSLLLTRGSLGGVYGLMNRALCNDLSEGRFVSLFVAVFDPRQMTLEFQNAGHPAPILYTPESGEMIEIESNAPALGILDEISAGPCPTIPVRKGDWLITYTDGVTEAHDADRQLYGDERLKALIRRTITPESKPDDLMGAVQNELREWSAGRAQGDDVTLVAAHFV
jgi:serine phosphatase RsbU (regulator of sigma subunit)